MTLIKKPFFRLINTLGLFCVILFISLFVAYQLFVTPQYTRIPFSQFFRLSTLKQIVYQPPNLGQPQNFPDPNLLTVQCQPDCIFSYQDKTLSAMVDNDPNAQLTALTLQFFDPQPGLIGYENTDKLNPTFYVLDLSGRLLQTIRLNLNQFRILSFVNYYPQTKEILFKSTHQADQTKQHWLYSAVQPSLRQVNL